jgi:cysteine desulfurase/selenocysteine lyase
MDYLGQIATLRVSLYYYNTKEEIDKFIEVTKAVQEFFNKN